LAVDLVLGSGLAKEAGLNPFAYFGKKALLRRVASTMGPTARVALENSPGELEAVYRLLKKVPKGGTIGRMDSKALSAAGAPGFAQNILGGKNLEGDLLNRLLPEKLRSTAVTAPAAPEGVWQNLLQTARRHPVGTALGVGVGAAGLGSALSAMRDREASRQRGGGLRIF
jgi:hypothetical protein